MSFRSHNAALAGQPAVQHSPVLGRDAAASSHAVRRERPRRRSLNALREILTFLATGADEAHAANRYRR